MVVTTLDVAVAPPCRRMSKKRKTPFQSYHAAEFGLRVCERAAGESTAVVAVACRFCEVFGKEEATAVGRKRSRSDRVKYFKAPFRKENYSAHNERMHSAKWAQYCDLNADAKMSFFDIGTSTGSQATMHAFVGPHSLPLRALIDKDIVDVIIGEMMFHPEDMDGVSRARLLTSFVPTLDSSEEADAGDISRYAITVNNPKQLLLIAQYLATGLSFRQVSRVIVDTKEVLGIGSIASCSEGTVSSYARFICAMNLQRIAELLRKCWAFSIALDMATHMGTAYCDTRIRICHDCTVHDFHLLSIPIHDRHTGAIIFNTFAKAMDALFPDWRKTIIGAASDGERKMTGRHQGVMTRIQQVAKPGFMRVWCGAHQLDLCMQSFYLAIPEAFYSTLTSLVAYLRRQQNFISDERSQCPLICDTRWLNMIKVTTWFDRHRLAVAAYLEEKKPACKPDESWWILLLVVHEIAGIAAISCKSLQGHGTLLCNQHHTLKRLVDEINSKVGVVGRLSDAQRGAIDETTNELSDLGNYSVVFTAISGFMEDLGVFVKDRLAAMDNGNRDSLLRLSASAILGLVDGISAVVAERTKDNEAYLDAAPAVLPHQLVRILPRDFSTYLQRNRERLEYTFSALQIENIGRQHKALCDSYCREPGVKSSIDSLDDSAGFHDAWIGLHNMYPFLERFAGGLATIFPGTSTVESDFSVVKYEKNKNRMSLSDASLEGILHAKQYRRMCSLRV